MLRFSEHYIADVLTAQSRASLQKARPRSVVGQPPASRTSVARAQRSSSCRREEPAPLFSGSGPRRRTQLSAERSGGLLAYEYRTRAISGFYGGMVVPRDSPFESCATARRLLDRVA